MNKTSLSRAQRVRLARKIAPLTRISGSRKLLNNYERTQNEYEALMAPTENNETNINYGSSRFLRTMKNPYNSYKVGKDIEFLTKPSARRSRKQRRTRRNSR